jgi:flavodoxin
LFHIAAHTIFKPFLTHERNSNQMKKILVVTYSQSGQLNDIVNNVINEFGNDVEIVIENLQPDPPFPFPWTDVAFWDAMPNAVDLIPTKLKPFSFNPEDDFDLVILGYPIWFLSPAIPITSFLKSPEAAKVMSGKPVVTIIGSRNMWVNAQEDIKKMILTNGAKLVGNIVLRDKANNLASVVTIIYWMMTAKKDRLWGIFPKPGISDIDIAEAKRFGKPVYEALKKGDFKDLQNKLLELGSVDLVPNVVFMELRAKIFFRKWSRFIRKNGEHGDPNRIGRLKIFKWYLLIAIFVASPIAIILFYLFLPLTWWSFRKKLSYFKGVDLKTELI